MKKALSILLALTIGLSFVVCAAAKEPLPELPNGEPKFKSFVANMPAGAALQGLSFELPTVTGIEAVWNGEILVNFWSKEPYFAPKNVSVTVSFADEAPEMLTYWWDEGNGWWWEVFYVYDAETGKVTFYYIDIKFYEAYIESIGESYEKWNSEDLYATLPQWEFTVPTDLWEQYINSLTGAELKLDVSQTVSLSEGEQKIFSFTPQEDGYYRFYSLDNDGDPYGYLFGPDFEYMQSNDDGGGNLNFAITAWLEGDKTYYLVACEYYYSGANYKVMVTKASGDGDGRVFKLWASQYRIHYKTSTYINSFWLVERNDYNGVLVNGEPLDNLWWFDEGIFVEGTKPGKIITLTFTTADGKTVLGTVDMVCEMSPLQWFCYYFLFGWIWIPGMPIVRLNTLYTVDLREGVYKSLISILKGLWYGVILEKII